MAQQINNSLNFVKEYKSIRHFEPVQLDNFSIFTGKNGSGKTHLLEAIKSGHVTLDSFNPQEIVYFNFQTFKTDNSPLKHPQNRSQMIQTVCAQTKQRISNIAKHYSSSSITDTELETLKKILEDADKSLFDLDIQEMPDLELWEKVNQYQIYCKRIFSLVTLNPQDISIIKKSKNFIDHIEDDEYVDNFLDLQAKDNFIPIQLGMLFYDYQLKLFDEINRISKQSNKDTRIGDIEDTAATKCNSPFDGKPPWDMINEILSSYSDMDHEVIEPQQFDLSKYNVNQNTFPVIIKDKFSDKNIDFADLSSGEKILFALTLCIFKEKLDNSLPKILLLDEIDATLHPSMIKNLLKVINDVFVKKNIKVILATHSPSTIALCENNSIFVIDRKNEQLIEKTSKREAMSELTQGYASIEEGFHFLDQIRDKDITIITEGTNTEYIQKAIDLFAYEHKDKIYILPSIKKNSSHTILSTLFNFFSRVEHEKKIIFVFDPDCEPYRNKLQENNNTYFYILGSNEQNTMTDGGIETLFDDKFFVDNDLDITKNGGYIKEKIMNKRRKPHFMKKMIEIADKENFKNFKPFFDRFDSILKAIPKS